jgi:DNA recombination protein RmuC
VVVLVATGVAVVAVAAFVGARMVSARQRRSARGAADADAVAERRDAALAEEMRRLLAERATADREVLTSATEQLVRLNHEMMEAQRRLGAHELDGKKSLIDQQLDGMRTDLGAVMEYLRDVERARQQQTGELTAQLQAAGRHTQVLADTTQSLREALSSTSARGQWGERMAEDVLRLAGFVDGVNYRKRHAIEGSGGIPDYTFMLPQGLQLHMDVKFPLNNYLRFLDATSDVERERCRKDFLKDVRMRLKEVTGRGYADAAGNTVDCVLLFIPNEQVYGFIHEHDRTVLDDALRQKVVFCSPLTLFAVLAVVRQAVDNFRLSQTSHEILELLAGFQKQWEKFVDQMDKVGRAVKSVDSAFEELRGTRARQLDRQLDRIDALRQRQALDAGEDDRGVLPFAIEA